MELQPTFAVYDDVFSCRICERPSTFMLAVPSLLDRYIFSRCLGGFSSTSFFSHSRLNLKNDEGMFF